MSVWVFCPFFDFFVLSCISSLYILEINPLLVTSFANIFSQSVGCLFILLMVSFAVLKLLSLIWLGLSLSFFKISFALGDSSKKTLLWFISENVLCMFSSRNFMVAGLVWLTIGVRIYFWALYSVPWTHESVFVPVPCCFDDCSFVVLSEAWVGYVSSFVLFPQDCFDNSGSLVLP